jgi:hypothetical protein
MLRTGNSLEKNRAKKPRHNSGIMDRYLTATFSVVESLFVLETLVWRRAPCKTAGLRAGSCAFFIRSTRPDTKNPQHTPRYSKQQAFIAAEPP